jgi:hypothetical protein
MLVANNPTHKAIIDLPPNWLLFEPEIQDANG